jgi:hypothetical protein
MLHPGRRVLMGTVVLLDDSFGQAELMRRRHRRVPPPQPSFAGFRLPPEVKLRVMATFEELALAI